MYDGLKTGGGFACDLLQLCFQPVTGVLLFCCK